MPAPSYNQKTLCREVKFSKEQRLLTGDVHICPNTSFSKILLRIVNFKRTDVHLSINFAFANVYAVWYVWVCTITLVFGIGIDKDPAALPQVQQPVALSERQSEKAGNPFYWLFNKLIQMRKTNKIPGAQIVEKDFWN